MNSVNDINIENRTYYFFDDMINIKSLDPNKIKVDVKSYICSQVKNLSYTIFNSLNHLPYY